MTAPAVADLEILYDRHGEDVAFAVFLLGLSSPPGEEELAELIELDGRKRLLRRLPVDLERYLSAVPDLPERPDALDAAIEVALRAIARSSRVDSTAVDQLVGRYPALAEAIRETATLNNAIWSTTGLQDAFAGRPTKSLPCEFGPMLPDGRSRYELRSLLGVGASSQVYLAIDRKMSEAGHEAKVAVKVLPRAEITMLQRVRLTDEATKVRRIDHINVVRVIDRGTSEELEDYIVSEYVEGGNLGEWLKARHGDVPVRQGVALAAQVARGVQAAHSAGLVHCDLKPANILISREGSPKVTDFGIAMRIQEAEAHLRQLEGDQPIGNLAFISPEQYRMEEGAFSAPSDIYALGGLLYLLLADRLPNGSTIQEIAARHARISSSSGEGEIRIDRAGVDRDLQAICRRALAPEPGDRYSAAGSFADELESWLRHEPLYWTKPSFLRVARLWVRRQPMAAVLLFALLASLAVSGGVIQYLAGRAEIERSRKEALHHAVRAVGERVSAAAMLRPASTRLLEIAWWHSYLTGQQLFGAPVDDPTAWRATFTMLDRWVIRLDEAGLGHSLDALAMKRVLAFWCIGDGQFDRAQTLLADIRAGLSETLHVPPGDPWWSDLEAYELMVVAGRGMSGPNAAAELTRIGERLQHHEQLWSDSDRGSPEHLLLLETLEDLYGPARLDIPAIHERYAQLRGEIAFENVLRPVERH